MFTKLVRVGKDAELRFLPNGTAVCQFSAVYDIGYGDKKRPQWITCSLFGKQAENVSGWILKGRQVVIYADEIYNEEWQGNEGKVTTMKAKLQNIEFVDKSKDVQQAISKSYEQQVQQASEQPATDEFEDSEIPF